MQASTTAPVSGWATRFVSIGIKLAAATVAVVAIVCAGAYFAVSRYERRDLLSSKQAAAEMVSRLFVATAVAPLTFADEKGVDDVVGLLRANDDIVYAAAFAASDGVPGARLGELRRGTDLPPPSDVPAAMRLTRTRAVLVVDAPVVDPTGKTVGVVRVAFSLAHEYAVIAAVEQRTLAIAVGLCLTLTTTLFFLARRVILLPLADLVVAARALERGEDVLPTKSANDEIGRLGDAFTSMSCAIKQREACIAERNHDLRRVLDNVEEGFVAIGLDGTMSEERSKSLDAWFGVPTPGDTIFEHLGRVAGESVRAMMKLGWAQLELGVMPADVVLDQLPRSFLFDGRHFELVYRPIWEGDALKSVLVVARDVTLRVERERAEERQRLMMVVFKHMTRHRVSFDAFCRDAEHLLETLGRTPATDVVTVKRALHTLKGNAAIFGLDALAAV